MRFVRSFTLASALGLFFATTALADLTDPSADTSIPLRDTQLRGPEPGTNVQPADIQPFTNSNTNSIARPEDFQTPQTPSRNTQLGNSTGGGDTVKPFSDAEKNAKTPKQHSSTSSSGGIFDVPKKSVELSDDATKGSLELTDKAAKSSLGLADRAAKTSLGVPGKILKSLF